MMVKTITLPTFLACWTVDRISRVITVSSAGCPAGRRRGGRSVAARGRRTGVTAGGAQEDVVRVEPPEQSQHDELVLTRGVQGGIAALRPEQPGCAQRGPEVGGSGVVDSRVTCRGGPVGEAVAAQGLAEVDVCGGAVVGHFDAGGAAPVDDRPGDDTSVDRPRCSGGGRQVLDERAGCGAVVLRFGDVRGGFVDGRVGAPGQQILGGGERRRVEDGGQNGSAVVVESVPGRTRGAGDDVAGEEQVGRGVGEQMAVAVAVYDQCARGQRYPVGEQPVQGRRRPGGDLPADGLGLRAQFAGCRGTVGAGGQRQGGLPGAEAERRVDLGLQHLTVDALRGIVIDDALQQRLGTGEELAGGHGADRREAVPTGAAEGGCGRGLRGGHGSSGVVDQKASGVADACDGVDVGHLSGSTDTDSGHEKISRGWPARPPRGVRGHGHRV
ncbi:hypothetical protein [Streptomyces mirabilis]|uniref:hypothetical protein n=1 Tax=Streptomyces mirabilis TaxID=68239 RepID=UPI00331CF49B